MKYYISKRIISGNLLLLIAIELLTFSVFSSSAGQPAHAATVNVEDPFDCSAVSEIPTAECEALH